jgi:hypothetical protein
MNQPQTYKRYVWIALILINPIAHGLIRIDSLNSGDPSGVGSSLVIFAASLGSFVLSLILTLLYVKEKQMTKGTKVIFISIPWVLSSSYFYIMIFTPLGDRLLP